MAPNEELGQLRKLAQCGYCRIQDERSIELAKLMAKQRFKEFDILSCENISFR